MSKKSDKCTREMMGYSARCTLQPKSKISSCLKEASQYHEICVRSSEKTSGVSSGDSYSSGGRDAYPYRKSDGKVYINVNGDVPYNGRRWNGYCYAIYKNGEMVHWEDCNGNWCDNEGVLGGHDNGNARDN